MGSPLDQFLGVWEHEHTNTMKMLSSLVPDKYDFRPDAGARSIGEMAWHLAETDAYMSLAATKGAFEMGSKPPNIERPKTIAGINEKFPLIHTEAVARIKTLTPAQLSSGSVKFPNGMSFPMTDFLWAMMIHHNIHHRGQLGLMNRMAGGKTPGMYGPNREEMEAMRAAMAK